MKKMDSAGSIASSGENVPRASVLSLENFQSFSRKLNSWVDNPLTRLKDAWA